MAEQAANSSSAWRALHTEGIIWDGPVLVTGVDTELPLRLIATANRLAFAKGGAFALDIPREWLTPPPFLNPDGSINMTVDTGEARPERLQIVVREGRRSAVDLIAALNKGKPAATGRSMPVYVPEALGDRPELPMARSRRYAGRRPGGADEDALISSLDPDDFPTTVEESPKRRKATADAPTTIPASIDAGELAVDSEQTSTRALQPIATMTSRSVRHSRRSWAIRLSGLIFLLVFAAGLGAGWLHTPTRSEIGSHIPDSGIPAPFTGGDSPTETGGQVAQALTATATVANPAIPVTITPASKAQSESAETRLTPPPSLTAIAIGVGGETLPTNTIAPTATPTATATATEAAPLATEAPATKTPKPKKTATPKPTHTPKPEPTNTAVIRAAEVATELPTLEPTATATPEPTETPVPPTETEMATETATPQPEPTQPPTIEPTTVPATATPEPTETATVETAPPASPEATAMPKSTATPRSSFPSQATTLGEGELPAQVFTHGGFRYTIEAAQRGATIDEAGLTAVANTDWVVLVIYADNWSDQDQSLAMANFQLYEYGTYGYYVLAPDQSTGTVAQTLGSSPPLGASDTASVAAGKSIRFAVTYAIRPDTTLLQFGLGNDAVDLSSSLSQPDSLTDPGDDPVLPDLIEAKVIKVIDGQTILVEADGARSKVRYTGIAAPTDNSCYATESTAANSALVDGQTVYLERQRRNRAGDGLSARDVWITGSDGNLTLAAAQLAAQGAVVPAPVEPDIRFIGWIQAASDVARSSGVAIWGACGGLQTPVPDDPTAAAEVVTGAGIASNAVPRAIELAAVLSERYLY